MKDEETRDISTEIGFIQPSVPEQIRGKWFPDTPAKPGTRWFYRLLAIIILGGIIVQAVSAIAVLINSL